MNMPASASTRTQPVYLDDQGADDDSHRAERVVDHFEEGCPHVEVVTTAPGKDRHRGDVGGQPEDAKKEEPAGRDLGRRDEALDAFDERVDADREQDRCLRPGGEDLDPGPTPGTPLRGRPAHRGRGQERHQQAPGIGEHVAGIHQQSKAPGDQRADYLSDQDGRGDPQSDPKPGRFAPAVSCS